jgi:hypothetical protein
VKGRAYAGRTRSNIGVQSAIELDGRTGCQSGDPAEAEEHNKDASASHCDHPIGIGDLDIIMPFSFGTCGKNYSFALASLSAAGCDNGIPGVSRRRMPFP